MQRDDGMGALLYSPGIYALEPYDLWGYLPTQVAGKETVHMHAIKRDKNNLLNLRTCQATT